MEFKDSVMIIKSLPEKLDLQKHRREGAALTSQGRVFHSLVAAAKKALSCVTIRRCLARRDNSPRM